LAQQGVVASVSTGCGTPGKSIGGQWSRHWIHGLSSGCSPWVTMASGPTVPDKPDAPQNRLSRQYCVP